MMRTRSYEERENHPAVPLAPPNSATLADERLRLARLYKS